MMHENDKIKVMIVNDSAIMRMLLSEMVSSNSNMHVIDTARDGIDALIKIKRNRPDVLLVDLEMPNMDGLTLIQNIANEKNIIPVIVVSSYGQEGAKVIFDSLEVGALDFIPLPLNEEESHEQFKRNLISKIEVAARSNPELLIPQRILNIKPTKKQRETIGSASKVVVIGASTGGPRTLYDMFSKLPGDLHAGLLLVQHMPSSFTGKFAQRLDEISNLHVVEAKEGDLIEEGKCLVAPGDYHMLISPSHRISLNQDHKRFGVRPAVNVSMITASEVYGANTVGVLLTGMGQDGAFGMKMIKKRGGYTMAQDESSSIVFGMAKAANELDAVDKMLPVDQIPEEIVRAVNA
ncbi:MAG: chemotaxis response regulator protein-glutamate methylesterase [Thaumarchaeota archaeon]|nr:chemotaxis response regulator protein-glutamate methylesterase [Nitrososphaerota archaeon]MBI3641142.1 chemotaxis response regulator protein-glutamate methylesterase [Nitrososphaerota archaeon]